MLKFLFRTVVVLLVLAGVLLAYGLLLPAGPTQQELVQLKPGSSARHIAAALANAGIIRSQYAFLSWHYLHGRKPLKAGEYAFDHRATTREVYDRIAHGDIYFQTLVVPEGYNMFDIASAIEEAQLGKREDFLKIVRSDTNLIKDLDPQAPSLEGYLFPDTYHFTRTQSLHDMAAAMVRRLDRKSTRLNSSHSSSSYAVFCWKKKIFSTSLRSQQTVSTVRPGRGDFPQNASISSLTIRRTTPNLPAL